MQRSQVEASFDLLLDGLVHQSAVLKILSAVSHAVTDRRDLRDAFQYAVLRIDQRVQDQADPARMIRNAPYHFVNRLPDRLMRQDRVGQTDPFDNALHQQRIFRGALHVDHLILNRRTTTV